MSSLTVIRSLFSSPYDEIVLAESYTHDIHQMWTNKNSVGMAFLHGFEEANRFFLVGDEYSEGKRKLCTSPINLLRAAA